MARPRKLIGEYLLELNESKRKLNNYLADPDKALARSGLSPEQQAIIKSGDVRKIRDAIREEYASAEVIVVPFNIFFAKSDD